MARGRRLGAGGERQRAQHRRLLCEGSRRFLRGDERLDGLLARVALEVQRARREVALDVAGDLARLVGEHGVGVGKVGYLAGELGEGNLRAMRSIKRALDPQGLLNPGKKIPAGEAAAAAGGGAAAPDEAELPLFVGAPACMQ